ncbi:MAG: hypothetical protein ACK4YP_16200 [Myxococcota bacterium]
MKSRKPTSSPASTSTSSAPAKSGGGGGRGNAARAEQIKQRQAESGAKGMPTAGPSQDDRYYGKKPGWVPTADEVLKTDLSTRILAVSVKESIGALEVKIAAGFNQGLFEDMDVSLCDAKGRVLVDTTVFDVKDRLCTAHLMPQVGRITPDMVSGERSHVILRPR